MRQWTHQDGTQPEAQSCWRLSRGGLCRGRLGRMVVPWMVDWGSRLMGIDVYGTEGLYIPYFYALGDQIGANTSGAVFLRRREGSWARAWRQDSRHPVMLASLAIVLIVPIGLLPARVLGFSPTTRVCPALEPIAANRCSVLQRSPERRRRGPRFLAFLGQERHVAHLAAGADGRLAVDVERGAGPAQQRGESLTGGRPGEVVA